MNDCESCLILKNLAYYTPGVKTLVCQECKRMVDVRRVKARVAVKDPDDEENVKIDMELSDDIV